MRELAAFTAKTGDLDLRFTPAPTALEGMLGHARVVARRGAGYQAEKPLSEHFDLLHIGKTLGTLFPLLKAMALGTLDRVFFLTAKTSGRRPALDAMDRLRAAPSPEGPALRVLELVAREKSCVHPDKACHGASCPLAPGFYDRLADARQAAQSQHTLDQGALRALAAQHGICPYFLGQELARWSDVLVGDVNHYFDLSALLHALTLANEWKVGALVDEAHNLLERGRAMYSAELDPAAFARARRLAPPALKGSLAAVRRAWQAAHATQTEAYRAHAAPPATLFEALGLFAGAVNDALSEDPDSLAPEVLSFHFDALHWRALAETFGTHSLFDIRLARDARGQDAATLGIRNVVPAPFLSERLKVAHTAALFSATPTPAHYYREMLGLAQHSTAFDLPSPFKAEQLDVRIAARLSTRYADRAASVQPIVALIARQYRQRPGNYLAFFSSFDYLEAVAGAFSAQHPDVPCWTQSRGMPEADRAAFLARFVEGGQGIGFAVLGGVFAEGIDLPRTRLIGAFTATLGLPPFNPVNEAIRARLDALFGTRQGYDYAYLYLGLQKVVQAFRRVIRGLQDRGTVGLIDDRYLRGTVRELLPRWWRPRALAAPTAPES